MGGEAENTYISILANIKNFKQITVQKNRQYYTCEKKHTKKPTNYRYLTHAANNNLASLLHINHTM